MVCRKVTDKFLAMEFKLVFLSVREEFKATKEYNNTKIITFIGINNNNEFSFTFLRNQKEYS